MFSSSDDYDYDDGRDKQKLGAGALPILHSAPNSKVVGAISDYGNLQLEDKLF